MALRNPGTSYLGQSNYINSPNAPQSIVGTAVTRQNGNLFQVSTNGGRFQTFARTDSLIFNVLDYGADPTGVADSTVAINAAIKAALIAYGATFNGVGVQTAFAKGGNVYLPAGQYKITSTLYMGGSVGFIMYGDGPTNTQVVWHGTNARARWLPNTAYSGAVTIQSHGCSFSLTQNGTSSNTGSTLGGTTSSTVGTLVTDGSCQWICNGYDLNSDMVRFQNYITSGVEGIEFITASAGSGIGVPTSTPRAVLCSFQDSTRLLSNTGFYVRDVNINWHSASGFNNQHDVGILWDYCNNGSGFNNSEGCVQHFQCNGSSLAAIQIWGAESQDHFFQQCNIPSTNTCSVQTVDGGSFAIKDSNTNATKHTGTVFVLGAVNDRILIDHCIWEDVGRVLMTGSLAGPGNFGAAGWPVTIRNCRWGMNTPADDGQVVIFKLRGPLVIENNQVDGLAPATNPMGVVAQTSGNPWPCIVRNNCFSWSSSPYPADHSFIQLGQGGCVETNNLYTTSTGDTVTRLEHGSLTGTAAPSAWAQPVTYFVGSRVSANGNTYQCVLAGTTNGSGVPPSGTAPAWNPVSDGVCKWIFIGAATDGTKLDWVFEIPMFASNFTIAPIITTRTGASTASIAIQTLTKTLVGFSITLSAVPTGTDSLVIDWQLRQG